MDVVRSEDGTVYNRIQRQHDEIPTLPPRRSILPVLCMQRTDADADSTSACDCADTTSPEATAPSPQVLRHRHLSERIYSGNRWEPKTTSLSLHLLPGVLICHMYKFGYISLQQWEISPQNHLPNE